MNHNPAINAANWALRTPRIRPGYTRGVSVPQRVDDARLLPGSSMEERNEERPEASGSSDLARTPSQGEDALALAAQLSEAGGGNELDAAALHTEDHALIRRAQSGEEQAFAGLVARHQQRAWRVARNLVPSDEDAQDLAQEAFLRVFRNLDKFDFEHGFTTWLYRIVTNLAIDHLRKRRPAISTARFEEDEGEFDLPDTDGPRPSDGLEHKELAVQVRECLASLAPHFQSVLVLREIEGLPCNEIARIVGATHVTVRWRLHRGRKLFQDEWQRRARLDAAGGSGVLGSNVEHSSFVGGRGIDEIEESE